MDEILEMLFKDKSPQDISNILINLNNILYSELPGNKGIPINNSAAIQPKLHISIEQL